MKEENSVSKFKKKILLVMLSVCLVAVNTLVVPVSAQSDKDIYLFIGQSNMAGRATIEDEDLGVVDNAYLFNGDGDWELAENIKPYDNDTHRDFGFNRYSTVRKTGTSGYQGLSPAYGFAKEMGAYAKEQGREIGLVVNAVGGTRIGYWAPGASQGYYNEAVKRAKAAVAKGGTIKGIIWHQGETDISYGTTTESYMTQLERIVTGLRTDLNAPDAIFVAGQLKQGTIKDKVLYSTKEYNDMFMTVPDVIENSACVSTDGLVDKGDNLHFDSPSQRILGKRYATKAIELLKKNVGEPYFNIETVNNTITMSSSTEITDGALLAATYTSDRLLDKVTVYPINCDAWREARVDLSPDFKPGDSVRSFLWDGLSTQRPLSEPVLVEVKQIIPPAGNHYECDFEDMQIGQEVLGWKPANTSVYTVLCDGDETNKYLSIAPVGNGGNGTTVTGQLFTTQMEGIIEAKMDLLSVQPTDSRQEARWSTLSLADQTGKRIVSVVRNQSKNDYVINGQSLSSFPQDTEWATLNAVMNFVTKTADIKLSSVDGTTEYYVGESIPFADDMATGLSQITFDTNRYSAATKLDNIVIEQVADADAVEAISVAPTNLDFSDVLASDANKTKTVTATLPDDWTLCAVKSSDESVATATFDKDAGTVSATATGLGKSVITVIAHNNKNNKIKSITSFATTADITLTADAQLLTIDTSAGETEKTAMLTNLPTGWKVTAAASEDESIATASFDAEQGTVTAKAVATGETTITATAGLEGTGFTQTIDITVKVKAADNANLASLCVKTADGIDLIGAAFDKDTVIYEKKVTKAVTSVTIDAAADDENANIAITSGDATVTGNTAELKAGVNVISIAVTSPDESATKTYEVTIDNTFDIAEGFSHMEGKEDSWGFVGGGAGKVSASVSNVDVKNSAGVEPDTLKLFATTNSNGTLTKTLDSGISSANKVELQFDWQSNIVVNNGRHSYFALQDTDGKLLFAIYGHGKDGIKYTTTTTDSYTTLDSFSNSWYTVSLAIDFTAGTINGKIVKRDTGETMTTFDAVPISNSAANLGKLYALDIFSAATMSIDNVYIKTIE